MTLPLPRVARHRFRLAGPFPAALAGALAALALFAASPSSACDPGSSAAASPGVRSSCDILTTSTPFTPHPANPIAEAPAWFPTEYNCFSVVKDSVGYVLLFWSPPTGFHRLTSIDGVTWAPPDSLPVVPTNSHWYTGIKCPDLRFDGDDLILYFTGSLPSAGMAIGRAVSTDRGVTWSVHPTPVLTQTEPYELERVDSPSVVRYGGQFVMSYMTESGINFHTSIAFSPDGITWTRHPGNPVITAAPGTWYDSSAGRPRLLPDPDGTALHLFFTGTTDGRPRCARIGHSVSSDTAQTWTTDPLPALDLNPGDGTWNDISVWCTSFVWEGSRLSAYFVGVSSDPLAHDQSLGLAQAVWPLNSAVDAPAPQTLPPGGADALLASPNPFTRTTSIRFARNIPLAEGSASVSVHDVAGRLVRRIWTGAATAVPGLFVWDGHDDEGNAVASGRYLVRATNDGAAVAAVWVTRLR
ncbi:MAG: FlgD immunoglobulin-like domain containing protein [Gemmatimonadota bacterium]|jgi:hypothetical protein|nr:FlgD immunoglobulin-like domain containing protein [Gemmatimonadota bacterium]MDP6803553.1 FlgD immunoglobulin-like domain containing protein [Gemmatimonadota bacterium]